ncbi:MAG: hypothetical protein A2W25_05635 [candidate division Zixibacteria bacterium RBG_16_53_22]|nr:MAG: hypothetical protein A2W25_05635 [candidate division Zixibacteria bacterium RBG_16_53_22]
MQTTRKLLTFIALSLAICSTAFAGQYSPSFPSYLASIEDAEHVDAIITMADQVDLRALQDGLYAVSADRQTWHETVVRALQDKATLTQADIVARLNQMMAAGQVDEFKTLWLGNVIVVKGTIEALDELVSRSDVLRISPDYEIESIRPVSEDDDIPIIAGHEIGLQRIHATDAWAMGYTGEGRLVSNIDTGVDGDHEALSTRWAGNDPRYAGHPEWAWLDPFDTHWPLPDDQNGHGTHTMGTICGRDETNDTIGVAIDAQWIAAAAIDRGGGIPRTVADALLSFQWIADPDENPGTVWDVPDVCSNSWGVTTGHGYPPCDETFWVVLDGCEAAGVVVVFAAGNESFEGLRRPADRATTDYMNFAVGAVDGNNANMPIADFSSRGPSSCTPDGTPTFKPEVSAPGVNVRSSLPGNSYGSLSGTSMACPHVAGVVALVRQANPNLTAEQVKQIIYETAEEAPADGDPGEDNNYGMGVVNAVEAVQRALMYLEGWGTLGGIITDQATGNPIQGAQISVMNRPWHASSRPTGQYYIFMPADTAWTVKVEFPPTHLPIYDTITVIENDTVFQNYALEGKVPVLLRASFGNPVHVSYRSFFLKGSWNSDGFWDGTWSGPLLEIKDDGQAPDQTANDGVFTGQVLLARDLIHTYSWAIYSENYGGEAARLQSGADFQILNLTPPTVPTLAVNPSGSDNNWMITAFGDNGLNLDLTTHPLDNRPTKWGAATPLDSGLTYTFRFRVMHSTVASYGAGGIGGANITFNCQFTGSYDFIFDDRDDSYIVQLTGTEGPPQYLTAHSGLDGHIPVSWLAPGQSQSVEMSYDDGLLVNAYYWFSSQNLSATMFVPTNYPVLIDSAIIHTLTEGDPYWPWPDDQPQPIGVSVFLDDGTGQPAVDPAFYVEATGVLGDWVRADIPEILVSSGNFWIAVNNIQDLPFPPAPGEGFGLDAVSDYPGNQWMRLNGVWQLENYYAGDHMIRAKVFGEGAALWMKYDSSPAYEVSANIPANSDLSRTAAASVAGINGGGIVNRMAYHPNMTPADDPFPLDDEVLAGYNLYRSITIDPYNGGNPANRVNGTTLIVTTSYDDWGGVLDSIVNGVTYYYQGAAVYDIGNNQFVEVGPSNQDTGMAVNRPPYPPFNVQGTVNDRTITATWSFGDSARDLAHFNVYKRLMPHGTTVLVGSPTDQNLAFDIPMGEDGVYKITVSAVDDGAPPLESEPSVAVYVAVGHLPPGSLAAVSGYEFSVPLRWMLPGSWRAGAGDVSVPVDNTPRPLDLSHKGEIGPSNPPMLLDRGGPDAFGYEWVDSDEPDGPTYEWRDITGPGTQIPMSNDDQNLGPFDIGFDFSYYGVVYNTFNVCSNGWISFTSTDITYFNQPLPNFNAPLNMIGPFWDDLYPPTGGEYWYYSDGSELVVSFINVPHIGGGGPYTFQIVLRSSGTMYFEYMSMGTPTDQATVGIQNGDGTIGLQMAYNAPYLHDEMAIRIGSGPEGIPPVHFNLYRSTSPNVPLDPAHLINGSIPGGEARYTDANGIQNGVTYYYKLTAVWPDSVESPASNEASGTPANHPPTEPFNVQGTVNDRTINITWSHNDAMGDRDHFNIYKQMMPSGQQVFVGSTPDSVYSFVIPAGEDGVYQVTVTAVDDGTPPMESGPSEEIFLPVGHLPPTSLIAVSGAEFAVPLSWDLPGSWRAVGNGDISTDPVSSTSITGKPAVDAPRKLDMSHKGESGPGNPPMLLGRGGPDAFGYEWVDSDEPDGPAYQWTDITGDGVQVPMSFDDQNLGPFDIGFDVDYYGQTFSQFYICSNGWISFTSTDGDYWNQPLPYFDAPYNMIAPFWDDLYPPMGGEYWYRSSGTELIVSFNNVVHITGGGTYTFQLVLRRTGSMFFYYDSMVGLINDNTIGIQNGDGTIGLQVVYNADYMHDQLAIKLSAGAEGFPPVHYKLYRATSPNVPVDPGHLRNGSIPGDQTSYLDFGGLQNGVTYYYKLTAVWPDSIESPASNEAAGTPANHPPSTPFALTGLANGRLVTLDWSFTNTMGDWANFRVYKKLVPGGDFVLVGSFTDSTAVVTIPAGEDGVYAFAVTAVDNGAPPLESDRSNTVYVPVGNLPPLNLAGSSDQEGYVPLHWNQPGLLPRATISYDDGTLANAYYFFSMINMSATMFEPSSYPTTVDSVMIHVLTEGDAYWPWPDGEHQPVGISVFLDDGSGYPQTDPVTYLEATAELGQWIVADIPDVVVNSGNFWVAMNNTSDLPFPPAPGEGIGLDAFTDFQPNQWWRQSGSWSLQNAYAGDHMIRAIIIDNGMRVTLSEKAPSTRVALALESAPSIKGLTVSAGSPGAVHVPTAQFGGGDDVIRPLDTEDLVGYAIYRSTSPNVPIDTAHRIRTYIQQGLSTSYNDSAVTNGTTYYYKVTAVYNNPPIEESPGSNEISATPRMGARMVANPLFFNVNGPVGQITTANLNISNPGGLQLDYNIVPNTDARTTAPQRVINNISFDAVGTNADHQEQDKSSPVDEPNYPPMLLGRGGPDAFGYIWIDSDEPGGPSYQWRDITGQGVQIPITGDDEVQGPFSIGFDFPFYDVLFNSFNVCSNGFVSFTSFNNTWTNTGLPDPGAPPDLLAPFWDDLYPPDGGEYWYYSTSTELVISYLNVPHIFNGGLYTFQIVLSPSGMITYNYQTMISPSNEGTVGIQNSDGSIGLQVAYNQDYVHDGLAVRFVASWLSTNPMSGSIAPGGNQNVSVIFDATNLDMGDYSGSLILTGSDINRPVTPITIPVTFHVGPVGVDDNTVDLPKAFALSQNYPNPFNPTTEIKFDLPIEAFVNLQVFNVLGQKVKTLVNTRLEAGYRAIVWDGADDAGKQISSGTYFYVLKVGGKTFTRKMTMLK